MPAPLRPTRPTFSPGRTCRRHAVDDPLPADLDHQATNGQHGNNSRNSRAGSIILARAARRSAAPSLDRCRCRPRSSTAPKPTWRGRIHLVAFLVSIPAGLLLVLLSQGVSAHVGAAIFAVSLAGLFGVSAIYHTGNWAPHVRARLRRMDHAMIFVLIAGSYTPITLLALQPAWGISLLAIVWTVAVIGVTLALARFGALHRAGGYLYIGMGWIVVIALPAVVTLARARRSSRCCSPAVCSTRSGRSGCGCNGRTPVRWCSGTTRCGTR